MHKKVVLITGASSGIGLATATYLSQKGCRVYGTSRKPVQKEFPFTLIPMEVSDNESVKAAVKRVIEKEKRIDVLINNAGMGITGPIEETPNHAIHQVFNVNFFGAIEVMKAVLPQMREQQSGLIINITSIAGYMGLPFRGIYSASKGALELVTEAMRMEVRSFGIQITNLAPGDFATNIAAGRYTTTLEKQSVYAENYQKSLDLMNAHVDKGEDPERIALQIEKIIQNQKPKIHYKEGTFIQKFSIVLKRILPDKWYEKMLMNHYKL
jgi:short-subunit dehydrogenase